MSLNVDFAHCSNELSLASCLIIKARIGRTVTKRSKMLALSASAVSSHFTGLSYFVWLSTKEFKAFWFYQDTKFYLHSRRLISIHLITKHRTRVLLVVSQKCYHWAASLSNWTTFQVWKCWWTCYWPISGLLPTAELPKLGTAEKYTNNKRMFRVLWY